MKTSFHTLKCFIIPILLQLALSIQISAQSCDIQPLNYPVDQNSSFSNGIAESFGQTFIACQTGVIRSISVKLNEAGGLGDPNAYSGQVNLWLAAEPGENNTIDGDPPYQIFEILNSNLTGVVEIPLNNPFSVISGNEYRMEFQKTGMGTMIFDFNNNMMAPNIDTYPQGRVVGSAGVYLDRGDLNFNIRIETPDSIPTMSQWGIIILLMLMIIMGVIGLNQKSISVQNI